MNVKVIWFIFVGVVLYVIFVFIVIVFYLDKFENMDW